MTEDEAKTKWCPFARNLGTLTKPVHGVEAVIASGTQNRGYQMGGALRNCLCIGSACMAFRWLPDTTITVGDRRVTVSPEDADFADAGLWWGGKYAKNNDGYLHRLIAARIWGQLPKGMFVDHIDGDPLNNRRQNLRLVTPAQNAANAAARGGASAHRGVHRGRGGRWVAQIARAGARLHLGTFDTEAEAAAAYDLAAADIHGEFARLNLSPRRDSGRGGFCGLAGRPS